MGGSSGGGGSRDFAIVLLRRSDWSGDGTHRCLTRGDDLLPGRRERKIRLARHSFGGWMRSGRSAYARIWVGVYRDGADRIVVARVSWPRHARFRRLGRGAVGAVVFAKLGLVRQSRLQQ